MSPFTITPAASSGVPSTLEVDQEGQLALTIASLAAPDQAHDVLLQALLVGEDGKGKQVDWLAVASAPTLRIAGGKTETVTIVARPPATGPRGRIAIKLAIADKDRPEHVYAESPPVRCEIAGPPAPAGPPALVRLERAAGAGRARDTARSYPRWFIPVIAGTVLLLGAEIWIGWKLWCGGQPPGGAGLAKLGDPCDGPGAPACGPGLVCVPGGQKCLLAAGASCRGAQASLCASGECEREHEVCAIPLGGACVPGEQARMPCSDLATCDPATKTCVERQCAPNQGKPCSCGGTILCSGACSAPACSGSCKDGRCCIFSTDPACGGARPPARRPDFNSYILKAIDLLYERYRGLGYDAGSAFTHDLDYSKPGEIKAHPRPPATMCVAAVSEVIIVALKLYADEHQDRSVFDKLPGESWMKGKRTDIKPYMFLYDTVDSHGTADALTHFGIGEHRPFPTLVPGDFVGFNRSNGSGHAVVFMGYLNAKGQRELAYDSRKVVGFKYFSAQGRSSPDAGLGYRWAFFGKCPRWKEAGKYRDCGVIASDSPKFLNTGYMLHPAQWATATARRALRTALIKQQRLEILSKRLRRAPTIRDLSRLAPRESRQLEAEATRALSVELPPISRLKFDGATTDD